MRPVDEAAGREIDALLSTALASIRKDPQTGVGRNPAGPVNALLGEVHARWGWPGIYRTAVGCARICTHGLAPHRTDRQRSQAAFAHFGSLGESEPDTPTGYRVSRFVVALMQDDEATAWLEFQRWQPDEASPPSQEMQAAMLDLLQRAWSRQSGETLTWQISPGGEWPPECDFCCHSTAQVMYRCRPFRMASGPLGSLGGLQTVFSDSDHWYACRQCAALVDAAAWASLLRRHRSFNPPTGNPYADGNMRRMWARFAKNRYPKRYPLPDERPTIAPESQPGPGD